MIIYIIHNICIHGTLNDRMPPPEFIGSFFLFLELHRLMCYTCDLPQGSASLRQACDASPTGSLKDLFSIFFFSPAVPVFCLVSPLIAPMVRHKWPATAAVGNAWFGSLGYCKPPRIWRRRINIYGFGWLLYNHQQIAGNRGGGCDAPCDIGRTGDAKANKRKKKSIKRKPE